VRCLGPRVAQRSVTPTAGHTSHLRACPPARPFARALALTVVFFGVARWCVRQHAKWVCDGDPRSDAAQRAGRTSALQPSGVRRRNSPQIAYTSDGPAGVLEASRSRCGRCVCTAISCAKSALSRCIVVPKGTSLHRASVLVWPWGIAGVAAGCDGPRLAQSNRPGRMPPPAVNETRQAYSGVRISHWCVP
jgi:hypothetical protein